MSSLARWTYTNTAMVRPFLEADDFNGGATYGEPYEIACTWTAENRPQRDQRGAEFVSRHAVFTEDARPRHRDQIQIAGTWEEIRAITNWDMSPFGEPDSPDFKLVTGWGV